MKNKPHFKIKRYGYVLCLDANLIGLWTMCAIGLRHGGITLAFGYKSHFKMWSNFKTKNP